MVAKPAVVSMTVRFPNKTYEILRKKAFKERTTMNKIVVDAVEATNAKRA